MQTYIFYLASICLICRNIQLLHQQLIFDYFVQRQVSPCLHTLIAWLPQFTRQELGRVFLLIILKIQFYDSFIDERDSEFQNILIFSYKCSIQIDYNYILANLGVIMWQLTQATLPVSLQTLEQLSYRSSRRLKYVAGIIRNRQLIAWEVNEHDCHAEKAVVCKVDRIYPEDILLLYRSGKNHSYPCNQCLDFMVKVGIKKCAYWTEYFWDNNRLRVALTSKMTRKFQSSMQRRGGIVPCIYCPCPLTFQTNKQAVDHGRTVHNGRNAIYAYEHKNKSDWERGKYFKKSAQTQAEREQSGWQIGKNLRRSEQSDSYQSDDEYEYIVEGRRS